MVGILSGSLSVFLSIDIVRDSRSFFLSETISHHDVGRELASVQRIKLINLPNVDQLNLRYLSSGSTATKRGTNTHTAHIMHFCTLVRGTKLWYCNSVRLNHPAERFAANRRNRRFVNFKWKYSALWGDFIVELRICQSLFIASSRNETATKCKSSFLPADKKTWRNMIWKRSSGNIRQMKGTKNGTELNRVYAHDRLNGWQWASTIDR